MNSISYQYRAEVVRVVDGDTVDFTVLLGFHCRIDIRTRLYGIDAPEMSTQAGKLSKAWLMSMLLPGLAVQLATYKDPTDKYGRWLATIFRADLLQPVNELSVAAGHAVVKLYP